MFEQRQIKDAIKAVENGRQVIAFDIAAMQGENFKDFLTSHIFLVEVPAVESAELGSILDNMAADIEKRSKETTKKITDIPKLKALLKAGWSYDKIADEFGVTEPTVSNTMKREGITRKSVRE